MKLTSMDISTTASASSIVFDALRKAIIQGQLEEGEPLRQDEIARLFNTSRIPVREAISRLEEQGLVKTQRYKGAVVAGLSPKETEEIFDLRALVEPEIIKNAVPRMSKEILASAREKCAAFSASDNPMEWGDLNRDFHETLYSASDLKFFREIAHNAIDRVERQIRAQLVMSNGMERAGREHFGIMDACEAGDADLAADLTGEHILGAKKS
ncbi:MAG: GntR family transcriptional regulator, partial [Rhodobacteraceae bacterium]|nr:GntR family transcriptional regulator [Paracoccaceae bacterium]